MNQTSNDLFCKVESTSCKAAHWIKTHGWFFSIVFLAIIVVLIFDLMYSNTHFVEVYESTSDRYAYSPRNGNNYTEMIPFKDVKIVNATPGPIVCNNTPANYRIKFVLNEDGEIPDGSEITCIYPDGSEIIYYALPPELYNLWDSKSDSKMITNPVLIGKTTLFNAKYIFVVDDQDQLWLEQYSPFQSNSPKVLLKTQNHSSNILLPMNKLNNEPKKSYFYVNYQQEQEDSTFLYFEPIDPHQVILHQREKDQVRSIRLQLIELPGQKNPMLFWDKVEKVRKPIHLPLIISNFLCN